MTTAREDLLAAGLAVFDRDGFKGATVAAIRTCARASNGSFFHFFGSKKELAGTLFLEILPPVTTQPSSQPSINPAWRGKALRG